ncbi:MAG: hypothetical protein PGN26_15890 [Xylophilus ampelinus]
MLRALKSQETIRAEISDIAFHKPGIAELWREEPYFIPQRRLDWKLHECNWDLVIVTRVSPRLQAALEEAAAEVQTRWNLGINPRGKNAEIWINAYGEP